MEGNGASCGESCLRPTPLASFFEQDQAKHESHWGSRKGKTATKFTFLSAAVCTFPGPGRHAEYLQSRAQPR